MAFTETTNPSKAKKSSLWQGITSKITSIVSFTRRCIYQMSDFIVIQILSDMGSDDDVCDLTIAANVAGDITHLGDLEKIFIHQGSQLYAMEFLPSPLRGQ